MQSDPATLHEQLLAAYRQKCTAGWPSGPNDGYFFEHLAHHLIEAGRKEELRALLLDFAWLQAKLNATDANALVTDYRCLPADETIQRLGLTLGQAAHIVSRDLNQLAGQLLGRLLDDPAPEIQRLLEQVRQAQRRPCLRPLTASLRESEAVLRTLAGRTESVQGVAVTPDGQRAVRPRGTRHSKCGIGTAANA